MRRRCREGVLIDPATSRCHPVIHTGHRSSQKEAGRANSVPAMCRNGSGRAPRPLQLLDPVRNVRQARDSAWVNLVGHIEDWLGLMNEALKVSLGRKE